MNTATEILEFKGSSELISASLVYDGGDAVTIPPQMGAPRADQMQGTPAEQLCELAGRVCYDSLGKGRPSFTQEVVTGADPHTGEQILAEVEGYHDHIAKVGHGSVWEHFNFTIEVPVGNSDYLGNESQFCDARMALFAWSCLNRPGILVLPARDPQALRITLNLRTINDWLPMSESLYGYCSPMELQLLQLFVLKGSDLAPNIVKRTHFARSIDCKPGSASDVYYDELAPIKAKVVEPISDNERWVSLFISGSRGLSHELVRHGDFTAISQRSTRFVDESESEWVEHPLTRQFMLEHGYFHNGKCSRYFERDAVREAKSGYRQTAKTLEHWLADRGLDKTSARKQARGAARGYLGNALYTELIFSASVAQWKRILKQRASQFADAEIREMACKALLALKQSRYGSSFDSWRLEKSPDGIGFIAVESSQ